MLNKITSPVTRLRLKLVVGLKDLQDKGQHMDGLEVLKDKE